MPQATFLAFLLGLFLLFLPPKGPPTAPSAQLAFPFYYEDQPIQTPPRSPFESLALEYGT